MTSTPTIAFVHGAFADSSGWASIISTLDAAGLPVIADSNQLRGLGADADHVRSVLATIDGPVVLVGHSYGGAVIGEAGRGVDNVAALVFVAAYVLDEGESTTIPFCVTEGIDNCPSCSGDGRRGARFFHH